MPEPDVSYLEKLRHTATHVMAQAVCELYPGTKLTLGPVIEDGFFYDMQIPQPIADEDLPKIEKKMAEIIKKDYPLERAELPRDEALARVKKEGNQFKAEIIEGVSDPVISFYKQGPFTDMCRGGHLDKTGEIKAFKLLSVAGAYWRGDEKKPQLTRIYGTAWPTQEELDHYLKMREQAAARDHRKLGKELGLFQIYHDEGGAGLVYYHPKGAMLRMLLENFLKEEHIRRGYQPVMVPHIAKQELWAKSGHLDYYKENMYFIKTADDEEYVLKPMNCPEHILIYKSNLHSYRELPIRFFELGTVYRYERSGVLHGLLRVRGFTQDDSHIFCEPNQIQSEISGVLDFIASTLNLFGFTFEVNLSTRPEKYAGTLERWDQAEAALKSALESRQQAYTVDPGGGVFYGPKIDIKLRDAMGREWQGPTIQVDFNLPERFDLHYIGEDGGKHRPVMVHRAIFGSIERFLGGLIEQYGGAFPAWLAPVQVKLLPIADRHAEGAQKICEKLMAAGVRAELDDRREKIGLKIREAEMQKIPYMLVVGDKELEAGTVAVRQRGQKDLGVMGLDEFVRRLQNEVTSKQ